MKRAMLIAFAFSVGVQAQEADSGFELRTTLSQDVSATPQLEEAPRDGAPVAAGFRAILYPTWKLSSHWTVFAAVQVHSRPYFYEEFDTQGYGVKTDVLQANLSYSRFWKKGSVIVRFGQLQTAFGSFLLGYDDAVNPLIDMPLSYGYYETGISTLGLAGAQVDATLGKADFRAQFVNSSPANPLAITAPDQYGNWAGGAGYTIRQGFRVGVSAYRGPYLSRDSEYFLPGEVEPRKLPGTAYGLDVEWGRGHWNMLGEWQKFQFDYTVIPTFMEHTGYAEARRVLTPRWYLASRVSYLRNNAYPGFQAYEIVAGYRPNRYQLVKAGYEVQQGPAIHGMQANTFTAQLVTSFRAISMARD